MEGDYQQDEQEQADPASQIGDGYATEADEGADDGTGDGTNDPEAVGPAAPRRPGKMPPMFDDTGETGASDDAGPDSWTGDQGAGGSDTGDAESGEGDE